MISPLSDMDIDWPDLSPELALAKMVEVFRDPDVALRPLAKQLEEASGRERSPQQLDDTHGEER